MLSEDLLNSLDGAALSCSMGSECKNSVENVGEARTKCHSCKLSPAFSSFEYVSLSSHWKPIDGKMKHPVLESNKRTAARNRQITRNTTRRLKDRAIQSILFDAGRAERTTERKIIKATKNSGRSNRDGDHLVADKITLDTKLQSKRLNPVVKMTELHKVRQDALSVGNSIGALVLRTKSGAGVVALREEDFALLISMLVNLENNGTGETKPGCSEGSD